MPQFIHYLFSITPLPPSHLYSDDALLPISLRRAIKEHLTFTSAHCQPHLLTYLHLCPHVCLPTYCKWTGCAPIWGQPLSSRLLKFLAPGILPSLLHSKTSFLYWLIPISTQTCWIFSILMNKRKQHLPSPLSPVYWTIFQLPFIAQLLERVLCVDCLWSLCPRATSSTLSPRPYLLF